MARGDLSVFEEVALHLGDAVHDLPASGNTIKVALINSSGGSPADSHVAIWGTYSAREMSSGNGYTTGGETIASQTYTEASGVATFDGADVSWSQNASGFSNAYYAIVYNDTDATGPDKALAWIDLAGPLDLADGDITISWNASGIFTVTVS